MENDFVDVMVEDVIDYSYTVVVTTSINLLKITDNNLAAINLIERESYAFSSGTEYQNETWMLLERLISQLKSTFQLRGE